MKYYSLKHSYDSPEEDPRFIIDGEREGGWGNGYVIMPIEHPLISSELDYNAINEALNVEITFKEKADGIACDVHIHEQVKKISEIFNNLDKYFVIGFDTNSCLRNIIDHNERFIDDTIKNIIKRLKELESAKFELVYECELCGHSKFKMTI